MKLNCFSRADLVFTGGQSLYEAKLGRHDDLHVFPSSIEFAHFAQARTHSGGAGRSGRHPASAHWILRCHR